jgi:hypothetical protein
MYKTAIKVLCSLLFSVNSGIPKPEPELSVPEISGSVFSGWISVAIFITRILNYLTQKKSGNTSAQPCLQ